MSGQYIVIEGQDATGKSTQVELLAKYFRKQGREVVTIHEPDGNLPSASALRRLIKTKSYRLQPKTNILLFTAARLELWKKLAEPCLKRDGIVISARNWYSTLAYQGYGQKLSLKLIKITTQRYLPKHYLRPDHVVILTLEDDTRKARQSARALNVATDTFESKPDDFQERVTRSYLRIARDLQIPTLDASPSPAEVHKQIIKLFGL
ncbi:dTMP kinase [Candidatus Saccharibacteria bacterium]|nr:dTMP kinase [Candidatus Saccharibacteria bacterium]